MGISNENLKKAIDENRNAMTIRLAMMHQNRLRFHAVPVPSMPALASTFIRDSRVPDAARIGNDVGLALDDFLRMVSNIIPHDKFEIFKSLFRFPVKTNEILKECFDKLSRVFEGRNPVFDYQFTTPEARDDWEWYRTERLGEPEIWATKGWEFFRTEINSVLIVDMPNEQAKGDRYPQPYFYWLPISSVIAYDADADGQMRWIAFRQGGDRIAVIDDERYRVFASDGNAIKGAPIIDNPHDIGYCPAHFFWDDKMSLQQPDLKRSPVTDKLDDLDWFLFFAISKRHLDLYGSYPIYSGYEQSCDYSNAENGDTCDGGFLRDAQGAWKLDVNGARVPCPSCQKKKIVGAGSFVEVPIPVEGQPDLRNPVQMLNADTGSLRFNVDEETRLRTNIITSIVGTNEEITTRDALNEQQIRANFESQKTVLFRIKKGFEKAQRWVDATCCRARYGDVFLSASISYGDEFYLYSPDELREKYQRAKDAGMSEAELDAIHQQIIETEYRNNPQARQRMLLLADVEPFRHLSRDEVADLYAKGIITREEYTLKLNFADFIRRFERENINILEFGEATAYDQKIRTIKDRLMEYAREAVKKSTSTTNN